MQHPGPGGKPAGVLLLHLKQTHILRAAATLPVMLQVPQQHSHHLLVLLLLLGVRVLAQLQQQQQQ
jgi:hypothetical protein